MTDPLDDFLNGTTSDPDPGQGGKGLRAQLEAVLAERTALKEQLAQVQKTQRTTALDSLFTKHGIPPLARDFFPTDTDPSDEAATSFVEKYGQLWGAQAAPATTPPAQQSATAAMQQLAAEASQPPVAPLSEEQYAAKFAQAATRDEFLKMLAEYEGIAVTGD